MTRYPLARIALGSLILIVALIFVSADVHAEQAARPSVKIVPLHRLHHSHSVTNLAWSPDGRLLATVGILSPDIMIWDARTGRVVQKMQRKIGFAEPIAFSPDGRFLITSATENHIGAAITVWERGSWKIYRHVSALFADKPPIWSAARLISVAAERPRLTYSPNRRDAGSVAILNTETWKIADTFSSSKLIVSTALALTPDGNILAVGGGPKRNIFIVDLPSKRIVQTIRAYSGYNVGIASLAFSRDGKFLASGHNGLLGFVQTPEGKSRRADAPPDPVRVWRVSDGTLAASARGGPEAVRGLSWSPDGSYLAFPANDTPARDFEIRLWDIKSDRQATAMEFPAAAFSAAFSPDGKYLAGVGGNVARIVGVRR